MVNERLKNIKSFSDYVQIMIDGLKKEWVRVSMDTFGLYYEEGGLCFGCAATNALCQLMNEPFDKYSISSTNERWKKFNRGILFSDFDILESSFDKLRLGYILSTVNRLKEIENILAFKVPSFEEVDPPYMLPEMDTINYKSCLPNYEEYVKWLKDRGL